MNTIRLALASLLLLAASAVAAQPLELGYFVGDTQTQAVASAWRKVLAEKPELEEQVKLTLVSGARVQNVDRAALEGVDLLILSTHEQAAIDRYDALYETDLIAAVQRQGKVYGVGEGVLPAERYTERGVIWDDTLRGYFLHGGADNDYAMLKYVLRELGIAGLRIPEPVPSLDFGYYYPTQTGGRVFTTWQDFDAWRDSAGLKHPGAVRVAVSFYGSYYYTANTAVIDSVIHELEAQGAEALPFFGYPDEAAYEALLLDEQGNSRADVALAFSLRFAQPGTGEVLAKHDIPVINLITLNGRSQQQWRESREGLTSFEGTFQTAMPELGGLVAPTVVGSLETEKDDATGLTVVVNRPIPDQVEKAVGRALAYASLRSKPNADKKLAIFYYNYPPGRASIGASYLNVPESLSTLLTTLQQAGYGVTGEALDPDSVLQAITSAAYNVASYAPGELDTMLQNGNAVRVSQAQYTAWLDMMPAALRAKIVRDWGPPGEAKLMAEPSADGPRFVIPRLDFGNVVILPQPVRGWGEDIEKLYHAKDLAPHHQYVAAYEWLRREFKADAVIHVGTHGTLEWLDGKDSGLSGEDAPDALIGTLPNFYLYNVDVVGEGLVARRRGAAALIDHMTPPFMKGGTYGELSDLNELIKEYQINQNKNPELSAIYAAQIREAAFMLGIVKTLDLPLDPGDDAQLPDAGMIGRIQDHLLTLQEQNIPYGLHTFGRLPPPEQVDTTVDAIVSADRSLLPQGARVLARDMHERIATSASREPGSLLHGLAGGYLPGGNGGEPIRNPDAYPTGKNFYGVDPDKIPKQASWEMGVQLAEQMLADHLEQHGRYPEKVSFVIWGGETMRHEGVLESQILYLLGTRPVWNSRDKVVDIEVIPRRQLGRPRVDIVIASAAEGMFSNITILMDKAVQAVKALDEAENYVRDHYLATRTALVAKGYPEEQADRLAGVRIFDEPPGTYNLNTARIAESSGTWDSDLGMANDYIKKMGHGFGNGFWGEPMEDTFRLALSGTEKVVHS
ncbi:MAG TPA: cobaltochelatase subunit CobN, partial [Hyphomicrobiales bacterium]|nr:cobaltochelatase subunit CobN [Hyphomicrobiales bacterium]